MICYSFTGEAAKMVVSEEDVMNIMGGMEHAEGIKLNDHKRKLKNRYSQSIILVTLRKYLLSYIP